MKKVDLIRRKDCSGGHCVIWSRNKGYKDNKMDVWKEEKQN